MKLKEEYVVYDAKDGEKLAVATGSEIENFSGLLRANEAASVILDCLATETTEEHIVDVLAQEFDAPRETLAYDVANVLDTLRSIGALEE
ncbi:MAG: PqqD family protein [Eggerthellaceae bacterium]|nr:PqqD family protein [Eggerthellaceae bacterium]